MRIENPNILDVEFIVGSDNVDSWMKLSELVGYFDGNMMPVGLMGFVRDGEWTYVASTVGNTKDNFTKNMICDIMRLVKAEDVCLITDVESKQEEIASSLNRYGFRQEYRDGIMYSYRNKG